MFALFGIYPPILGVTTSFTDARAGPRPGNHVGLEYCVDVLARSEIQRAFINTFQYTLIVVPMSFVAGLAMEVFVNRKLPTHTISRLVFFAPFVLAATIVANIRNRMFRPRFGLVTAG